MAYKKQLRDKDGNVVYPDVGLNLDDVVYSDDPTEEIGSIIDPSSYSLDEKWTGGYWVDGRKIYKKTVVYTGGIQAGNNVISHGISGLSMAINKEFFGYRSSDSVTAPFPMYVSTNQIGNWTINSTSIQINSTFVWSDPVYITIYYVKTS